ncbi:thiolase-like protein [Obelidium mucronatum]|nr:thiolase-like protein [Obelidium mucronatum]
MTPDLDTDSVTAHYTRDVSLDYEIPPSPFKIQRMNNSTESAEIPIVSNVDVMPVASIPPSLASSKSAVTPCPPLDSKPEEIAIIGIGCRYPNDIYSPDEFWDRTLVDANSFITDIPTTTRKSFRRASPTIRGGFLSKEVVEEFDCGFFGLSPSEAKSMDPQHRLILETVHSALEDANIPLDSLKGTDTGVFIGCRPSGHDVRNFELFGMDDSPRYTAVGTDLTFSANRVSFWLDLKGPSHSVTSACSTGGVLLDIGVRSILQGQCKMAVVGAVSVMTHESVFGILKAAGIQSVAGKCASYDKDADGYVPTESSVVFIIKKLSDAVKCGDRIIATVSGISNRHKGREGLGISYPCGDANTNAINEALAAAKWTSDEVEFVEAHATGTKTGDPVEAAAIAKSFQSETRSSPVYIGAVKSIVGHTENVAALTSMVKVCLAMREDMIPPTLLDLSRLNPAVAKSFDIIPAEIPTKSTPWNSISFGKKSLVLAAGLGGSVIAVAMKAAPFNSATQSISSVCRVLTISAANPSSLLALRDSYVALISKSGEDVLNRIVVSSNLGRQHMRQRIAIPVENKASLIGSLQRSELHKLSPKKPTFIFVFPGQGSLDLEACAEMHRTVAAFRQCIQVNLLRNGFSGI